MPYVSTGRPRGRPRKNQIIPAATPVIAPTLVVLDSQSPISNLWMHDARECLEAAEWLRKTAKAASKEGLTIAVVNAVRLAADLRKQSAESLATAQERARAEKTTTAKAGLSILPPQTSRLLANAKKAIEQLAAAQDGPEAKDAKAQIA